MLRRSLLQILIIETITSIYSGYLLAFIVCHELIFLMHVHFYLLFIIQVHVWLALQK